VNVWSRLLQKRPLSAGSTKQHDLVTDLNKRTEDVSRLITRLEHLAHQTQGTIEK
jgi:hypothetical protein